MMVLKEKQSYSREFMGALRHHFVPSNPTPADLRRLPIKRKGFSLRRTSPIRYI